QHCLNLGANLVSIQSEAEYKHVKSVIRAQDPSESETWIGLSCCEKERTWLWSDGTKLTYTKWNPQEPNYMPKECCAHMNYGSQKDWNDVQCDYLYAFVCAKKTV
ncbi:ladderlectin, partial [Silurus asotus]